MYVHVYYFYSANQKVKNNYQLLLKRAKTNLVLTISKGVFNHVLHD